MAQASVISSKMTFWNLQRKVWDEVRISSTHTIFQDEKSTEKIKKVIATFYLTILIFFFTSGNCEFISHNSEGKKSQNCEIKSRSNLFYFCIRASIETCQMS